MLAPGWLQWTIVLVLTSLALSLLVVAQVIVTYWSAYMTAPRDIVTFIDTADFSIQENEIYSSDVTKVSRLEDKIRLGNLLREIQRGSDDLREDLNRILVEENSTALKTSARLLWVWRRAELEERVRRIDLLRMRFLVGYLSIITSTAEKQPVAAPAPAPPLARPSVSLDPEKVMAFSVPSKAALHKSLTESFIKQPPLRRLTTQAIGHQENVTTPHRKGWAGVVEELQGSAKLQRRHASIEQAMATKLH